MKKKAHIFPIILYLSGLGSLLASDILVTKFLDPKNISTWAEIRSLIGIASVLCLFGLDQALIRHPESSRKILIALGIQIPIVAIFLAIISSYTGISETPLPIIGLCIGSAGSIALFQYFRAKNLKSASQVSQQLWKHIALAIIIFTVIKNKSTNLEVALALAMLAALIISAAPLLISPPKKNVSTASLKSLYAIGSRFLITSLLLSFAIYAEQLIVSSFGSDADSAKYFTHSTYFLFPISVANGYLAFNLSPWIRENKEKFISTLYGKGFILISMALTYAAATHLIGWLSWKILSPSSETPDIYLVAILYIACVMRTIYLLPAGYFGVFGKIKQHNHLITYQIISLFISSVFFLVLFTVFEMNIIYATALSSLINWIFRTAGSLAVMHSIERARI